MKRYKSVKVRGFKNLEVGFYLNSGEIWFLLEDNPIDFLVDGLLFIRRKYVLREEESKSDFLMNKIYFLKNQIKSYDTQISLDSDESLFNFFLESNGLIQICLENQSYSLVGKVQNVNRNSLRMKLLSSKGEWLKEYNFRYEKIRTINFDSDYLKSLQLYLKSALDPS